MRNMNTDILLDDETFEVPLHAAGFEEEEALMYRAIGKVNTALDKKIISKDEFLDYMHIILNFYRSFVILNKMGIELDRLTTMKMRVMSMLDRRLINKTEAKALNAKVDDCKENSEKSHDLLREMDVLSSERILKQTLVAHSMFRPLFQSKMNQSKPVEISIANIVARYI